MKTVEVCDSNRLASLFDERRQDIASIGDRARREDQARHVSARTIESRANAGDCLISRNALTACQLGRGGIDERPGPSQIVVLHRHQIGNGNRDSVLE